MVSQPQSVTYANNVSRKKVPLKLRAVQSFFRVLDAVSTRRASRIALDMMLSPRRFELNAKGQALVDSAEQVDVPFEGTSLAGYVWGTGDKTVLLVHGWESNVTQFRVMVERLVDAGYRVVAIDGPAHGRSPGKSTNLFNYGKAITAALDFFGPVYGIIAHSFGAMATLYLLGTQAEITVERLIVNGSPRDLTYIISQFAKVVDLPERMIATIHDIVEARFGRPVAEVSIPKVAPNITIPALMFHDQHDEYIPYEHGRELSQAWGDAQFVTTTGLGHRGALRSEAIMERILAFLA